MSKNPQIETDAEEVQESDLLDIDGTEDYGFVFSKDGELKHLFTPDEFYLDPPPVVKKILKLLGIKDVNMLSIEDDNPTIH